MKPACWAGSSVFHCSLHHSAVLRGSIFIGYPAIVHRGQRRRLLYNSIL